MVMLEEIRHSASHVLAAAVLALFPSAKLAIGPAVSDGFYYDFDLGRSLDLSDLAAIEEKMRVMIEEKQAFEQYVLSREDAIAYFEKANQPYKLDIIRRLDLPSYSFYRNGVFVDLCRGPHIDNTSQIGAVKLMSIAGAYWRGSEQHNMLQRIYGTAFPDQRSLDQYLFQQAEIKKRDHRFIGKALDWFSFHDAVGPGMVLWHPKGAMVRHLIETFWKNVHLQNGYDLVQSPHIGRSVLWETSGHLDFYKDYMYQRLGVDGQDYYLKPMNCPFHLLIYRAHRRSYRDLPMRFAELGTVYRYERSGYCMV